MANGEIFKLLVLDEFLTSIKKSVKEDVGPGYTVEINHVIKNNSIELDGLIILKEGERITPNIYLNPYYEKYLAGASLKNLADEIIQIYRKSRKKGEKEALDIRFEFNEVKPRIVYRLINYDRNRKLLQEIPHVHFMDLAVTFHCLVKNNEQGIGTIRITNEHIKTWNINVGVLKEIAGINTPVLFPPVIKNMDDILDILKNERHIISPKDGNNSCFTPYGAAGQNNMYVITNLKGINGASCLLYPDIIKNLAEKLESDLYILPSSIHEIIALKGNASMDKNIFREMVFDVNRTQVPEEDVLSDNVYFYSRECDAITV